MNAIRSVFTALSNLAASINSLAGLLDVASGRIRQQLALDDAPPALPGEVIDATAEAGSSASKRRKAS